MFVTVGHRSRCTVTSDRLPFFLSKRESLRRSAAAISTHYALAARRAAPIGAELAFYERKKNGVGGNRY